MLDRFARWITRHPKLVVLLAVLLLIPSVIGFISTKVNYDILSYLPDDLDSVQGFAVLDETFHLASSSMMVIEDMPAKDVEKIKEQIQAVDGVANVIWVDDIADLSIPESMLPDVLKQVFYSMDGADTLLLIQHTDPSASDRTGAAIKEIRSLMNKQCYVSGMSVMVTDIEDIVNHQAPVFIAIAIFLALVVLSFSMQSWLLPFLLLLSLGFAVAYNMGSNFFQGEISFLTQSIAAILQLAVTMDYSIFLLDRYNEEKRKAPDDHKQAMAHAIRSTFTALVGSSLTTVFGFVALCFMRLKLGFDIGFVMAKGVLLGILTVVILLPALVLLLEKWIDRYHHKSLVPNFDKMSQFVVKHRKVAVAVFVLLLIPCSVLQSKVKMNYNMSRMMPEDMPSIVGLSKLKEEFGMASTHFIIMDEAVPAGEMTQLLRDIENLDGVTYALGLNSLLGPAIPESMIPPSILSIVKAGGKQVLLVSADYASASDEVNRQITEITQLVKACDPGGFVTGESVMYKDMIEIANRDFVVTNILSIAAVLLLLAILFQSLSLPFLLVLTIELAIFINMTISYLMGSALPFIAPTVISCVQLGATVDYAVLLTTRFKEELHSGKSKKDAILVAASTSSRSICQSALVFFLATFGVYLVCDIELIYSLCALLARGAVISAAVSMLLLPALLYVCEPAIAKTTRGWRSPKSLRKESIPHETI